MPNAVYPDSLLAEPMLTEPTLTERLRGQAAALLDRLPVALRLVLAGGVPTQVDGQTFDPTLQAALALNPRPDQERLTQEQPAAGRARFRREILATRPALTSVAGVRDLTVEGAAGPLGARLYTPPGGGRPPLLVYFHGGGFVYGDLDTVDDLARVLCCEAGHAVLSVAYRLAPEDPFPASPNDTLAAFRWAQRHALALGADDARVSVGGDSAGGTLAAGVAQAAGSERPPAAQLLVYPATDTPTDRPSRHLFDGFFLADAERRTFHHTWTAGTGTADDDPRVSPIYGRLGGLAPALVVTAGFDVLRDEGEAYAAALAEAGTPVEAYREDALPHGFIHMTGISRTARRAVVGLAHRWRAFAADHA